MNAIEKNLKWGTQLSDQEWIREYLTPVYLPVKALFIVQGTPACIIIIIMFSATNRIITTAQKHVWLPLYYKNSFSAVS